ncbi:hypothetical protein LINPERPRIM_LOCUS16010 [Linum perenne]
MAWERGHRKIVIQMDSMIAIKLISNPGVASHQHVMEISKIQELLTRNW